MGNKVENDLENDLENDRKDTVEVLRIMKRLF